MSIQHLRNMYSSELLLRRLRQFHGSYCYPMPAVIVANPLVENYKRHVAAVAAEVARQEAMALARRLARCISTTQKIKVAVCHEFDITTEELMGPHKRQRYALPRQVAMHLARTHAGKGLAEVARLFERDETCVRIATRKVPAVAAENPAFARRLESIKILLAA